MTLVLSGTTGVSAVDGTAGSPALQGNDPDTGIYFPAAGQIGFSSNGSGAVLTVDSGGNITFPATIVMGSSFLRNRIINGNMYIAQRATSATVTAGTGVPTTSTGYPCVDRFFVYSTGANVTAAQVAGTGSNRNLLQVTGAASVTAVGIGQRIEALNSYDLAGQVCTLSVDIANSTLTNVTWTASYANTTDTFGTIGTPTKTQIATGTFTVSSTLTRYSVNITLPAAATTGIEILFTVGAQTSGTFQVSNVQFEAGSVRTPFERRIYGQELILCQRFYEIGTQPMLYIAFGATGIGAAYGEARYAVTKRASATTSTLGWLYYSGGGGVSFTPSTVSVTDRFYWANAGFTNWNGWAGSGTWAASAEL